MMRSVMFLLIISGTSYAVEPLQASQLTALQELHSLSQPHPEKSSEKSLARVQKYISVACLIYCAVNSYCEISERNNYFLYTKRSWMQAMLPRFLANAITHGPLLFRLLQIGVETLLLRTIMHMIAFCIFASMEDLVKETGKTIKRIILA